MFPILFKIGPFTLHTYGLMVALGFLAGFAWTKKEFDDAGLDVSLIDNLITTLMVTGIIGARVFYFATEKFEPLFTDPLAFFRIWEGGLVFFGGFLAACGALVWFAFRRKIPVLTLTDALAGPLLLAQALGRLGCLAAGCCYGKQTNVLWKIIFSNSNSLAPLGVGLHPTQLYEATGDLILFIGLIFFKKKFRAPGSGLAYYLFSYSTLRFIVEYFRGDFRGPMPLGVSPAQWISLGCVFAGITFLIYVQKNKKLSNQD